MTEPRSVRDVPGMGGKVFDFRGTGLCPPSGDKIEPLIMVHHIPVVARIPGTADFEKLGKILRGKGLPSKRRPIRKGTSPDIPTSIDCASGTVGRTSWLAASSTCT